MLIEVLIESDSISDNDSIYDSENDEALLKSTEIKVLVQKREQLSDAIEKAASESRTSDAQLAMLKLYGESIGRERPAAKELSDILTTYKVCVYKPNVLFNRIYWHSARLFFGMMVLITTFRRDMRSS